MQGQRNIAARAGRWSARHRKTAILGWITFVVLAFMVGGKVGMDTLEQDQAGVGDSGKASKVVAGAFPDKHEESVLIQSKGLTETRPSSRRSWPTSRSGSRPPRASTALHGPYDQKDPSAISGDGHSVLVSFEIPGDPTDDAVAASVDDTLAQTAAAQKSHGDFTVEQFGSGSSEEQFMEVFDKDLSKATFGSLPITLILLVIAFGTLVAAGVPLLLAVTGIVGTMGLIGPLSHLAPVEDSIMHVVLLIGLAVGVDYALFYLRRVREERAAGRDKEAAIEAAAATSGRAVLVSGFTVMIAMAGMYLAGAPTFTSFATGTIVVVAVAMIGSISVLPAVLSVLGDKVDRGRVPGLGRLRARVARVGIWSRIVDRVLRRPLLSAVLATGLLVAMALPALQLDMGTPEHLRIASAGRAGGADVQPCAEGLPGRDADAERGGQGQGRDGSGGHRRSGGAREGRR